MNIFKKPRSTKSLAQFRDEFRSNIETIGSLKPVRGRPSHSVLGNFRSQITKEVAARAAGAMVDLMEGDGAVFEPDGQFLYEIAHRGKWAWEQVGKMASVKYGVQDRDVFVAADRMLGVLIPIGWTKPQAGRRSRVFITTDSASPAELRIVASMIADRGLNFADRSHGAAEILRSVVSQMATDETVVEARARHFDAIRRGEA